MFRFFSYDSHTFEQEMNALVRSANFHNQDVKDTVRDIITQVDRRGDAALLEYTEKFDKHSAESVQQLRLGKKELALYLDQCTPVIRDALQQAANRVRWFHQHQKEHSWTVEDEYGNTLGQRIIPLASAGIYVPGGRAAYPSSVLMNALPAKVAGVQHITMMMPCPNGVRHATVLAAAALCDVDEVFLIGGAQAIAALTWGTETVPAVDKITGPGNAYVAEAKRQVFGYTGIDMIAGPSEIVVIADASCDPQWVALDMCAQAEHDPDARSILLSDDKDYIEQVQQSITEELKLLSRKDIIRQSLANNGAFILCRNIEQACKLSNQIAPEHLELLVANPQDYEGSITNAGAVFSGFWACESLGDYCAGPNHVLPTMTSARFSSPLGVYDFIKRSSYIQCNKEGAEQLAAIASTLAKEEGLDAHAKAADVRRHTQ